MERDGICTNLLKTYNGVRPVNETKTPIHFPEVGLIFPIEGSQNAVWRLALEGKISQNYENRILDV